MNIYTITGSDTLTIWGRTFVDFADGDNSTIVFQNDLVKIKTGKNKNTIFSRDESGNNCEVTLRILRGSADDRFLQGKLSQILGDFPSTELGEGQLVKRLGDGLGNVISDVVTLQGGVIARNVDTKDNSEGDYTQGISIYKIFFASGKRSIQ
ncbi:MAG: hypothetical protein R3D71_05980 [Rickettsiales bacterium]